MKISLRITTKTQAEFWIRMFKLEPKILWAIRQLTGPRKEITMPVVAEFVVDPELKWIYCLVLIIDPIGLKNGFGFVYATDSDPADSSTVYETRDRLADELLAQLEKGPGIDETHLMPEGKEIEEPDLPLPPER